MSGLTAVRRQGTAWTTKVVTPQPGEPRDINRIGPRTFQVFRTVRQHLRRPPHHRRRRHLAAGDHHHTPRTAVGRCHVIDNHHPDVKLFMEEQRRRRRHLDRQGRERIRSASLSRLGVVPRHHGKVASGSGHRADAPPQPPDRDRVHRIRRFILFHDKRHPDTMGEPEVSGFLSSLATTRRVSASTQNQALAAPLFLHAEGLGRKLQWMEDLVRAKRPDRLPVVLTQAPGHRHPRLRHGAGLPDRCQQRAAGNRPCIPNGGFTGDAIDGRLGAFDQPREDGRACRRTAV